jgi:hypothetical protein
MRLISWIVVAIAVIGVSLTSLADEPTAEDDRRVAVEKELRQLVASLQDQLVTLSLRLARLEQQTSPQRPPLRVADPPRPAPSNRTWGRDEINGRPFAIIPLGGQ